MLQLGTTADADNTKQTNRLAGFSAGLLLWFFVLVIPAVHTGCWRDLSNLHWWFMCLPLGVLGTLQIWPNRVMALSAMPLAHVPILIAQPSLTSPKVYGPEAFAAITAATVLWVWACRPNNTTEPQDINTRTPVSNKADRPTMYVFYSHLALHVGIGLVMLGALYFYEPYRVAMYQSYGEASPIVRMAMALFLFLVWVILIARQLIVRLARAMWSVNKQRAQWIGFALECADSRRSRTNLKWSLIIASLSYGVLWILMQMEGRL